MNTNPRGKNTLYLIVLTGLCLATSGCVIPALLGVKERRTIERKDGSSETITTFITGFDTGFKLSGTDRMANSNGIKPRGED